MRYSLTSSIVLSEDDSATPSKKIYEDENRSIVDTSFTEAASGLTTYAPSAAAVAVPLGGIATGKWVYLIGSAAFQFSLNAGTTFDVPADRPVQMFCDFTGLTISNPSAVSSVSVSWAIAGAD
jgi:hypothetical protein